MNKLILSARRDGLTERLNAIFNGLAIAESNGFDFSFVWPVNQHLNNEFHSVEVDIKNLFNDGFLDSHFVTLDELNELNVDFDIFSQDSISNRTISMNSTEEGDVFLSPLRLTKEERDSCADSLNNIKSDFSKYFHDSITMKFKSIKKNLDGLGRVLAVHLRSGDVVYGEHRYHSAYCRSKSITFSAALTICEKYSDNFDNIIIFGATSRELDLISTHVKKVITVDDFGMNFSSPTEQMLCEVYLMSQSELLVASRDTGVAHFAELIGGVKRCVISDFVDEKAELESSFEFIDSNLFSLLPDLQKSYIYMNQYVLMRNENCFELMIDVLKKAAMYDPGNNIYSIFRVFTAIKFNNEVELMNSLVSIGGTGDINCDEKMLSTAISNVKVPHLLNAVIRVSKNSRYYQSKLSSSFTQFLSKYK
ncbi:TPA: hypothetical protein NJ338_002901 [Vibrio parahaemolyticus]|nr:hypothetical protein [Vibrio parahaemolyticus]MBM4848669.1 hypothetical protein [Vibrio parahaemolyticus]MDF4384556.1 hypothetical protein [Vibrio parahaemolyticus]HCE1506883.1 hypothetical protein [Vibrio parahaemolyticus]HCE2046057.1 hypothetical protein [Vibrio parahaemolyticus]